MSRGHIVAGAAIVAAVALSPLPLAGAMSLAYMAGHDGLWIGLGIALGLVLAGTLLASPLQRSTATTPAALLALRFGGTASASATAILALALVLMLAGQMASLARAATALFGPLPALGGLPPGGGALAAMAVGASALLALAIGRPRTAGGLAAIVAIAALAAAAVALTASVGAPVPVAYGEVLREASRLELAMLGQKLADAQTLKAHATPYVTLDATSFIGALVGAAGGTAALAAAAQRLAAPRDADGARAVMAWGLVLLLPVLVLMPAMAAAIKVALYQVLAKPVPTTVLPDWLLGLSRDGLVALCGHHPVDAAQAAAACKSAAGSKGLLRLHDIAMDGSVAWLAGGRIAGLPTIVAALPAVAALAAALAAAAAAVALLQSTADPHRRGGAAGWLAAIAGTVAAAALALLAPDDAAALSWWVLPLAASSLLPVLVLALWWRRATPAGAVAGLAAGAGVTLYYLVATRYFPVAFYDLWQGLSPASLGAERKLVALRDAWTGADPAAKASAWQAVVAQARGMASWWGVKPQAAALFGLPAGVLAMLLVSLLTSRRSGDAGRLVERAHDLADGSGAG